MKTILPAPPPTGVDVMVAVGVRLGVEVEVVVVVDVALVVALNVGVDVGVRVATDWGVEGPGSQEARVRMPAMSGRLTRKSFFIRTAVRDASKYPQV